MEEKSSISRVKKMHGTYQFRIEGYSGISTRVADCVESPEFSLCGHKWQLRIFPGGSLESHKDFVSFYLASKSNRMSRASYKLIVLNQIIGGEDETFSSSGIRIFEARGVQIDGWGRDKFMNTYMLSDPDFAFNVDDSVTFKVEITVYGELEETKDAIISSSSDSNNYDKNYSINQCLLKLLHDPNTSDTTLIVGSDRSKILTHRCILMARSPVFYAMFTYHMHESISNEVNIPDFDALVINELLLYMYTDSCQSVTLPVDQTFSQCLFKSAVKYQVAGLISIFEDYFINQMNQDSVITLLQMADIYGAQHLKLSALQFIAKNSSKIIHRKEFNELDEDLLKDANKLIDLMNKRKGCGTVVERERRFNSTCTIN